MFSLLVLVCRYSQGALRAERIGVLCFCLVHAIFAYKMVVNNVMAASFDSNKQQLDLE